jgi:hypothetical protein
LIQALILCVFCVFCFEYTQLVDYTPLLDHDARLVLVPLAGRLEQASDDA